jgi:hypothetical protein
MSALRSAKADIEIGKHLEPQSLIHESAYAIIRELVTFLSLCRDAGISFQHEGATFEPQSVLDGLTFVLGVDELANEEEGICHGLAQMFATAAGT